MKKYPKILFININFRYDNSAGITISKLVDHIPKEKLYLLSDKANISNIDIFSDIRQLGKLKSEGLKKESKKRPLYKKFISALIGKKGYLKKLNLSEHEKNWLNKIKPEYIYIDPDSLSNIDYAIQIANYCNAKLIIHIMDDRVKVKFKGMLGIVYKNQFKRKFKDIVLKSSIRLSISDLMAEEYQDRYGVKFYPFHNPVDIEKWKPFWNNNIVNKKTKLLIIYSGSIRFTSKSIIELCDILNSLNGSRYEITFRVYSKFKNYEVKQKISSYSFTEISDFVSQEELPSTISKADFLFLPLSFDRKDKYTRLSMPTKTSEYMASGVPVIVYAPSYTALYQYARDCNWAYTISTNNKTKGKEKLIRFIKDDEMQSVLCENAKKLVREKHDVMKNKKRFENLIFENIKTK